MLANEMGSLVDGFGLERVAFERLEVVMVGLVVVVLSSPVTMKGLCWNCRGLNDPLAPTIGKLRVMVGNKSKYDFIFLMETKCNTSVAYALSRSLGYNNGVGVDSVGSSGGLWLGWNTTAIFDTLYSCNNFILVKVTSSDLDWYLCCVYGHPSVEKRLDVLDMLGSWIESFDCPFILIGDFNQVDCVEDKHSINKGRIEGLDEFVGWKIQHQLLDIPYKGPRFTWCNNRKGKKRVYERLDKAYASANWLGLFPNTGVLHYPIQFSDHAMIELNLNLAHDKGGKPYKIDAWTLNFKECNDLITNEWVKEGSSSGTPSFRFMRKLSRIRALVKTWALDKKADWNKKWTDFDDRLEEGIDDILKGGTEENYDAAHDDARNFILAMGAYWRQRAKIKWNMDGDTCSRFFFNSLKGRTARNFLSGLYNMDGMWCSNPSDMNRIIKDHFSAVYLHSPDDLNALIPYKDYCETFGSFFGSVSKLSDDDRGHLSKPFTGQEVRAAVFQLGGLKSPGPDGFPAVFFQKHWSVVKSDLTNAVCTTLNSGSVLKEMNRTFTALIPKVTNPTSAYQLRPISLCNVIMRITTKCIANRIKRVIGNLVGDFQNAFVPGRNINDNIIMAHELMHHINNCSFPGRKSKFALKIDFSKAFDRINWNFVRLMMESMNFPDKIINLIMNCITTVTYDLLVNGSPKIRLTPERELRQGDPLSPFLFVLCTEVLSANLRKMQDMKVFQGVQIARHAPPISHLFFADDAMFFLEGNKTGVENLRYAIEEYCDASGQVINKGKSSLCFSPNTTLDMARYCYKSFGIPSSNPVGKYLGVPLDVNRNSKHFYNDIYDCVVRRISSWNGSFLSPDGRLTLITSVLASLSVHLLSVFKIPVSVANRINKRFAHFWWAGTRRSRTIHWRSSFYLSLPKRDGGLGIRNIQCLNQALLAKLGWRIMSCPNTVVSKLLTSKYHCSALSLPHLISSPSQNGSWGWKSIKWGLHLVNSGIAWLLGRPSSIDLRHSNWVFAECPSVKQDCNVPPPTNISEILDISGTWCREKLGCFFDDQWVNKILSCQLPLLNCGDVFYWGKSSNGIFTVKSAYRLALDLHLKDQSIGFSLEERLKIFSRKYLWKIKGPTKLRTFLWKILNHALPIGAEFQKRGLLVPSGCPLCNSEDVTETLNHLFRDCPISSRLWMGSDLGINTIMSSNIEIRHWIVDWVIYLWNLDSDQSRVTYFVFVLWTIWIIRNRARFKGANFSSYGFFALLRAQLVKVDDLGTCLDYDLSHNDELSALNNVKRGHAFSIISSSMDCSRILIKSDAAWKNNSKAAGGWDVFSYNGDCVAREFSKFRASSPLHAEALALHRATLWARSRWFLHIHLSTDCLSLVQQLCGLTDVSPEICRIIDHLHYDVFLSFHCIYISYIPRRLNKEAHGLAAMGVKS